MVAAGLLGYGMGASGKTREMYPVEDSTALESMQKRLFKTEVMLKKLTDPSHQGLVELVTRIRFKKDDLLLSDLKAYTFPWKIYDYAQNDDEKEESNDYYDLSPYDITRLDLKSQIFLHQALRVVANLGV